jgi:hypothetical protein
MGHILRLRSSIGSVNAIMMLENGRKAGAGDGRGDNTCCGY